MEPRELSHECIVCFDPGEQTGVAVFDGGGLTASLTLDVENMLASCNLGWSTHRRNMHEKPIERVVCEQFSLYQDKALTMVGSHFVPCQVIGMIRAWHWSIGFVDPVVFQSANEAKSYCPDELLDAYPWASMLKTDHERDAARHGVLYLRKLRRKEYAKELLSRADATLKKGPAKALDFSFPDAAWTKADLDNG
jgi:hypothetical protein